jgi:DNA-binding HxlR family transcriptional regulator
MTNGSLVMEGRLADRDSWQARNCPVAGALDLVGTRSAMLIMREALYGTRRFDDFAQRVGLSEPVAAARLRELADAGLLDRVPYQEPGQRTRHEYVLTEMGRDLAPVVLGFYEWGGRYLTESGRPPLRMRHRGCGAGVHVAITCADGHELGPGDIAVSVRPKSRRRG